MVYIGDLNQVCFQEETTGSYGIDQSGTRSWIGLVQNFNPTETAKLHNIRAIGKGQDYAQVVKGGWDIAGTMEFFIQRGAMFKYVMGAPTTTGSPTYTHTMKADDTLESVTFELAQAISGATNDWLRRYTGAKINRYAIRATQGEPVMCTMDWVAQDVTSSTDGEKSAVIESGSPNYTTPFIFHHGKVTLNDGSPDVIAEITSFEAELNRNFVNQHYVDQAGVGEEIAEPIETGRDYRVTMTVNATETKWFDYVKAGSEIDIQLQLIRTSGTDYAQFDYYDAKLESAPINAPSTGVMEQTMTFKPKTGSIVVVDGGSPM